jgi:predicted nucleotidyltransferase
MLDSKGERTIAEVCEQLRAALGDDVVAVALYGSAAGGDWVAGVSDINIVAVVEVLGYEELRAVRGHVGAWEKKGVSTPLLVERRFLASAADVFPMELYDIREGHRILYGEDVFSHLAIDDKHLRFQCEQEARGKLLRLRELYLEIGSDRRRLRKLLLDSLTTFLTIMRHLTRSHGGPAPRAYTDVLSAFCGVHRCELPVTSRLLQIKLSDGWKGDEEELFRDYLREMERLVAIVDRINVGADDVPGSATPRP